MKPILWSFDAPLIGRVTLPAYFTMLAVGFGCALLLTWREARKQDLDADRVLDLNLLAVVWGIIGARLLHLVADGQLLEYVNSCIAPETMRVLEQIGCTDHAQCAPHFRCNVTAGHCHPPRDCLLALKFWRGGLSYYGGFLFAAGASLYYTRKHFGDRFWRIYDLAGYGVPLGLFWGRFGCFLNGCCYGRPTATGPSIQFPRRGAVWRDHRRVPLLDVASAAPLPVHPTQLYSSLLNLLIFGTCYFYIRPRKRFDGQVFWWFVILYAVARSAIEALRDDDRGRWLGLLSTSQALSIPLVALAVWMLRRLAARANAAAASDGRLAKEDR